MKRSAFSTLFLLSFLLIAFRFVPSTGGEGGFLATVDDSALAQGDHARQHPGQQRDGNGESKTFVLESRGIIPQETTQSMQESIERHSCKFSCAGNREAEGRQMRPNAHAAKDVAYYRKG